MVLSSKKSGFVRPTLEKCKAALGKFTTKNNDDGEYLKELIKLFDPIPMPGPDDWLSCYKEPGQTFEQFSRGKYSKVTSKKKTIYLQPLEKTITEEMISAFEKFLGAYFPGMIVKVSPPIYLEEEKSITCQINSETNKKQYRAEEILVDILSPRAEADAYCTIGCTMTDLCYEVPEEWVFGLADQKRSTGVFSFARYDENFFLEEPLVPIDPQVLIYRASKVMAHEIGHMFGIEHCIYFHCLMNGSNNLKQDIASPMEFCPICIRKLQSNIGFDLVKRYEGLADCFKELGGKFLDDIKWYEKALALAKEREA